MLKAILLLVVLDVVILFMAAVYKEFDEAPIWDEDGEKWITEDEVDEMEKSVKDFIDREVELEKNEN